LKGSSGHRKYRAHAGRQAYSRKSKTEDDDVLFERKNGSPSGEPGDNGLVLNVVLKRTGGTGPRDSIVSADLKRTAGTIENGTWTGRLNVASTANGPFKVTGVMTGPYGSPGSGTPVDPTPYSGQTITVKGTNLPKITASVNPKVVPWGKPAPAWKTSTTN